MNANDLVSRWRSSPLHEPPYLFEDDRPYFDSSSARRLLSVHRSFDENVSSDVFNLPDDTSLHVGLLPLPYMGDLQAASVFILMLNPGLSAGAYYAEQHSPEWKQAVVNNLRQEGLDAEYPFLGLDPRFSWHPGFEYWNGKFRSIAESVMRKESVPYRVALSRIARRVACLELVPYHSNSFRDAALLRRLPSRAMVRSFVHDTLVPKARRQRALIIVTRGRSGWRLEQEGHIVVYKGGEARSASLSLNSRGGRAISRHFDLPDPD
jgi:hypothetical protein